MARDNEWMAEHMLILGVEARRRQDLRRGAFPVLAGRPTWRCSSSRFHERVEGFDGRRRYAWLKPDSTGTLRAINPEAGFSGWLGHALGDEPNAMKSMRENTFYERGPHSDGDAWWEGLTPEPPEGLIDWHGNPWSPDSETPAAHPNARFTAPASQCPRSIRIGKARKVFLCQLLFSVDEECRTYLWFTNPSIGITGFTSGRLWLPKRLRRRRCLGNLRRIRWQCCLFAATTWATISGIGSKWARN